MLAAATAKEEESRRLKFQSKRMRLMRFTKKQPDLLLSPLMKRAEKLLTVSSSKAKAKESVKKAPKKQSTEELKALLARRVIHRQHGAIEKLPVDGLCGLLQLMEPVLYTIDTLRPLMVQGARQRNQKALSELVEFLTGLPGNTSVESYEHMLELGEYLCRLNEDRGRLGMQLALPPSWEDLRRRWDIPKRLQVRSVLAIPASRDNTCGSESTSVHFAYLLVSGERGGTDHADAGAQLHLTVAIHCRKRGDYFQCVVIPFLANRLVCSLVFHFLACQHGVSSALCSKESFPCHVVTTLHQRNSRSVPNETCSTSAGIVRATSVYIPGQKEHDCNPSVARDTRCKIQDITVTKETTMCDYYTGSL
eukprot:4652258-Amphidinium_carterae.3